MDVKSLREGGLQSKIQDTENIWMVHLIWTANIHGSSYSERKQPLVMWNLTYTRKYDKNNGARQRAEKCVQS